MLYLSNYGNLEVTHQLESLQRVGCDYWTQAQDGLGSVWLLTAGGLWPLTLKERLEHLWCLWWWCLWCLWCLECLAGRRVWAWEQNKRSGGSPIQLCETRGFSSFLLVSEETPDSLKHHENMTFGWPSSRELPLILFSLKYTYPSPCCFCA